MLRQSLLSAIVERGYEVVACAGSTGNAALRRTLKETVRCHFVRLDRTGTNPVADVRYLLDLLQFFREEKPQIVLNRAMKPLVYGSLAARASGVRRVYSLVSGLGYVFMCRTARQRLFSKFAGALCRVALRVNERVLFQNSADLDLFAKRKLIRNTAQAVLLNGAGVDIEKFQPAASPSGPIRFLLIGRLLRDKGVYEFVEAARSLRAKYPDTRFIMVGAVDTNPSAVPQADVLKWVEGGLVEWRGAVEDVRPCIGEASVFVLPSYREGSPRATLEAMAMGRPIVTTDAPGCRDTVVNGINGFVVPVGDSNALASAMEQFLVHPHLLREMGGKSRQMVCERFDVRQVNEQILKSMGILS